MKKNFKRIADKKSSSGSLNWKMRIYRARCLGNVALVFPIYYPIRLITLPSNCDHQLHFTWGDWGSDRWRNSPVQGVTVLGLALSCLGFRWEPRVRSVSTSTSRFPSRWAGRALSKSQLYVALGRASIPQLAHHHESMSFQFVLTPSSHSSSHEQAPSLLAAMRVCLFSLSSLPPHTHPLMKAADVLGQNSVWWFKTYCQSTDAIQFCDRKVILWAFPPNHRYSPGEPKLKLLLQIPSLVFLSHCLSKDGGTYQVGEKLLQITEESGFEA